MRYKIIFIWSILLVSCSNTKTVSYKVADNMGKTFIYQVQIPKGFATRETNYEHGWYKDFIYPDSSMFFFSNNILGGFPFPPDAYINYGKDLNLKFISVDTITLNGILNSGRLWKIQKATNVMYGYIRVHPEKREMFDSIINRVTIK